MENINQINEQIEEQNKEIAAKMQTLKEIEAARLVALDIQNKYNQFKEFLDNFFAGYKIETKDNYIQYEYAGNLCLYLRVVLRSTETTLAYDWKNVNGEWVYDDEPKTCYHFGTSFKIDFDIDDCYKKMVDAINNALVV